MPDKYDRHRRGSLVFGFMAIIVGIVFWLYQADYLPQGIVLNFWGVIFIVWGLVSLFSTCRSGNRIWALGLVAAGVMMQTNTMHLTHFEMRNMWPLIIILAGISALWHTIKEDKTKVYRLGVFRRMQEGEPPEGDTSSEAATVGGEIDMDFFMGGGEPRVESKNFRGGRINAMLGGFVLDLTRAEIEGDDAVLYVNTILGGGEIKVPETWLVEMQGSAILGGYDNKTRYFQPDTTKRVKRLIIRGNAILGGIEVKNA